MPGVAKTLLVRAGRSFQTVDMFVPLISISILGLTLNAALNIIGVRESARLNFVLAATDYVSAILEAVDRLSKLIDDVFDGSAEKVTKGTC